MKHLSHKSWCGIPSLRLSIVLGAALWAACETYIYICKYIDVGKYFFRRAAHWAATKWYGIGVLDCLVNLLRKWDGGSCVSIFLRNIILYLHILQPLTNSASGRTLNFFGCWVRARAPQRCYLDGLRGARAREPKGEKKCQLVSRRLDRHFRSFNVFELCSYL